MSKQQRKGKPSRVYRCRCCGRTISVPVGARLPSVHFAFVKGGSDYASRYQCKGTDEDWFATETRHHGS